MNANKPENTTTQELPPIREEALVAEIKKTKRKVTGIVESAPEESEKIKAVESA